MNIVKERHSTRTQFNPDRKLSNGDLKEIIEAARWAPTAHNMQNFDIIVVDDPEILKKIGSLKSKISEDFLRENLNQLSFSKKELAQKKVGILATHFPPAWRNPKTIHAVATKTPPAPLSWTVQGAPAVLIVVYDPRKRAPASKGDFLGIISLGCVMENMWLVAQSRGLSCQIMSVFGGEPVERELKEILGIPKFMKIAYALRLGYPVRAENYPRVRRDDEMIAHYNRY